ncbi:glycosyltransferase family 2 protein [Hydrogenophaga sp. ZJX-1]|uniref:glycosyltransferase family 2 protein n=1 Tax=Hydrogenophaga sp. ZJX-1 TaxID=3404778 RepID=UPI003B287D7C
MDKNTTPLALLAHYERREAEIARLNDQLRVDEALSIQGEGIARNSLLKALLSPNGQAARTLWERLRFSAKYLRGDFDKDIRRLTLDTRLLSETSKKTSNDYTRWVRQYDQKDAGYLKRLLLQAKTFTSTPKLSIVMPTYNPDPVFFRKALDSVLAQTYSNWELCICNDCSTRPEAEEIVQEYLAQDDRIRYVKLEKNSGISGATNGAIELATGDWVCFLDHDDELTQDALHWVVDTINQRPQTRLIYSDEDKIDENGNRFEPYFKSDFNYELMLAQNMVCHFTAVQKTLLDQVGPLRSDFDGSQDYDLTLRLVEGLKKDEIAHIPRILYHWRACEGSTALSIDNKNYALDAARRAVAEHLARVGLPGEVVPGIIPHYNRVKFQLPDPPPLVSIVIPTRDKPELIALCLKTVLEKTTYPNFEIVVVDNGSVDEQVKALYKQVASEKVRILDASIPFNFSRLVNMGVAASKGDIILLLNNDIEILDGGWMHELVSHAVHNDVGAVGAKLLYPDGRAQHNGVIVGIGGVAGHSHKFFPGDAPGYFGRAQLHQELSAVTGACLAIKRSVWEAVEGFDEQLGIAFNDVDFCLRVQAAGFRNVWTPHAVLKHHESASRGLEDNPAKQARFASEVQYMFARWGNTMAEDRNYSPNLSLVHEDFSLAWPPRVEHGAPASNHTAR